MSDQDPPMSRRRLATRARLTAAAAEVFTERGFGRATVEDVCERAGFSRGAFYSNFDSLDELFFALYSERAGQLVEVVSGLVTAATAGTGPAASLDEVVTAVVAALPVTRESHLLNLEFFAHALRHPAVARALAGHRQELRAALVPVLRSGLGLPASLEIDGRMDRIARAVVGAHEGLFLGELIEPDDTSLPQLRRSVLTGIVSAGRQLT